LYSALRENTANALNETQCHSNRCVFKSRLRTRLVWDQKKSVLVLVLHTVILVLQILCYVVKQSCHAHHHNDLGGHSSFSSTILVSLFCA